MNQFFTVKVKYTKQLEDGTFKKVTEQYLVASMTFTRAESRIYEELGSIIKGEFTVTAITRDYFHDIFHYEDADVWYKCKITYKSAGDGEEGGKAKKVSQNFLVTAHSVKDASERLKESLGGMMIDYIVKSVVESAIIDVFQFGDSEDKKQDSVILFTEFAEKLNGCEYREELTDEQTQYAIDNGLVVVFGASDDLTVFEGCISDEVQNGELFFNKDGEFFDEEILFETQKEQVNQISTSYHPFKCVTTIPHSSFKVVEDGELYGWGIVFSIHDIK